ncbi:gamma-glutamyltranspeptidase [Basidiobolus meristosporus CBS 931.73]|uniref:Gamma-glutamyltranspeptidase n=1 Tax=Basidiobolus meristosporus CBS 931.73 TaxID=1314790 RepID=A0A1Y1Z0G7_9FUNG|nr:gamma-glutamyltranspeptidase [Basidiobolus meristosporus CBS 931.73]|eukprot:ORY03709.1 gamma-glutamyltranspeptidase [Basidiobolus meristosporus CBS 931.73]
MVVQSEHRLNKLPSSFPKGSLELPFNSRRSPVYGTHAMVASTQPLATQAGYEILRKGGNAADAAIAVAACLGVVEPASTGIGGDCFCLFYDAKTKKVSGLNGSGRSSALSTLEKIQADVGESKVIPPHSGHAITVPGAAAGWFDTVENFGSGKLSMKEILEPAIVAAEDGFAVPTVSAKLWEQSADKLKIASPNHAELLIDGRAPFEGELFQNPGLAATYRAIAHHGRDGFYKGKIAQAMVDIIQQSGGLLTLDDLANHKSQLVEPISLKYEGVTVHECPANGQGITALMALGILEALQDRKVIPPLTELKHNSKEYLHAVIEALRIAFIDTRWYITDPDVVDVPSEKLLNKAYLRERSKLFNPSKAAVDLEHGSPEHSSDTVYLSVVDEEGNACSFIGVIPKGTGFTLQNRGCNFNLDADHPNCYAPSKRPYHTIIPAMATVDDELYLCYGVMGGFMQPQGHVQVLLNLLHYDHNPQHALDRTTHLRGAGQWEVIDELRTLGHNVKQLQGHHRAMFGRGQVIETYSDPRTNRRVLVAGSDPRGDGYAAGW